MRTSSLPLCSLYEDETVSATGCDNYMKRINTPSGQKMDSFTVKTGDTNAVVIIVLCREYLDSVRSKTKSCLA